MSVRDDGESPILFEPLVVSDVVLRSNLNDLALSLAEKSAAFSSSLPPAIADALADLVRTVNCYYDLLIEGRNIQPVDVQQAILGNFRDDNERRDVQLEALAYVAVQRWIDNEDASPFSLKNICETHWRFYKALAQGLLLSTGENAETANAKPGALRTCDVRVGHRTAISPGAVPRFLTHMEETYDSGGRIDRILASAYGHHRLLWVQPFPEGNGRIARLLSHRALRSVLRTDGLWSVVRGLALRKREYRTLLQSCDEPSQAAVSREERGPLSEGAFADFTRFFIETCIDQIDFMSEIIQPHSLRGRALTWVQHEIKAGQLPRGAEMVVNAILYRGELDRGEVAILARASDRSARRVTAALIKSGVVTAESSRSTLRLSFPAGLAVRFFPELFPGD
ncbi:Fic family protein [Rhizobium vallis]|uniref:Fic family protein n=1 Tax=Rhizobium vallis TaxID=634290 RepID=A0A432PIX2_9HYPH|nr:Fic family protein [Rhizobium vallis]RUM24380.1 Fic family protein [Rhizobium vallis]